MLEQNAPPASQLTLGLSYAEFHLTFSHIAIPHPLPVWELVFIESIPASPMLALWTTPTVQVVPHLVEPLLLAVFFCPANCIHFSNQNSTQQDLDVLLQW